MKNDGFSEDSLLKSRKQYIQLTVIFLFALALLHGLHSFFFTLFFWLSFGSGAMAIFYHIQWKRGQIDHREEDQSYVRQKDPIRQQPNQRTAQAISAKSKQMVTIVVSAFAIFFILPIIISVFSNDSSDSNGSSSSSSDQGEPLNSDLYTEAVQLYNSSDYRGVINLLKPVMTDGSEERQSLVLLGDSYYGEKNLDSAYVWYSKAYDLGERSSALLYLMAYIKDTEGNTVQAVSYYKEAVGMDSTLKDIYMRLSELEPENSSRYLQLSKRFE
jgi:tetratricopeptide (TPR) repeat protein